MKNLTYQEVVKGGTGHKEALDIEFDPLNVTINALLFKFLRSVTVTDIADQFYDRGQNYTTAIFSTNQTQERGAKEALKTASL